MLFVTSDACIVTALCSVKSNFVFLNYALPIAVTVRSKAYISGCSISGISGSNPAEDMDVRLLCVV